MCVAPCRTASQCLDWAMRADYGPSRGPPLAHRCPPAVACFRYLRFGLAFTVDDDQQVLGGVDVRAVHPEEGARDRKHPPNDRLRWARLQRGWSQDELVRQLTQSMRAHGESDTGLTATTVWRWETGVRRPTAVFRKHLVNVFGLPADELGLLSADELASRPASPPVVPATSTDIGPRAGAGAIPAGRQGES